MSQFYVSSLIEIIHYLSDALLQCDANTRVAELFCDEFDDVDFEMVLCCFEATHKVGFKEELINIPIEQYEELSLEEFLKLFRPARAERLAVCCQALSHVRGCAHPCDCGGRRSRRRL